MPSVGCRGLDEYPAELPGEITQVVKSGHCRDLFDRLAGMGQCGGGAAEALPNNIFLQRQAVLFREKSVKMTAGDADGPGNIVGGNAAGQVLFDVMVDQFKRIEAATRLLFFVKLRGKVACEKLQQGFREQQPEPFRPELAL